MKRSAFHILRVGLAITFLWIGVLILKDPEAWGSFIQPWAARLLPISIVPIMMATGVLDITIGALLLFNTFVWLAALVGAVHIAIVLTVSGITDITVRDIGILAGSAALAADSFPKNLTDKIISWQKRMNQKDRGQN